MAKPVPPTLIQALFDSLLASPPWLDFLKALEDWLDGHHATMVVRKPRPGDPGTLISTQSNTIALTVLQDGMFSESPILDIPPNQVHILREMLSEHELASQYSRFFTYIQEYGATEDIIGINLEEPETGMVFRLRCARLKGQANFSGSDRDKVEALMPWLRTAIGLYARLARKDYQLSISEATIGQLTIGSLVVDERGQVLMTNPLAERALETRDGLLLHQDRLVATGAGKAALQHALSRLFDHRDPLDSEALQLTRPGGRRWNLLMRCTAARPGMDERVSRTVLVLFRDAAGTREVNEELLMELFGLTRAEAVLTKRLVEGESLAEISDSLGRSRHTTRAQLAAIFSKTGTNRQPQLVSHVLRAAQQMWGE
ncbi:helix-turn-helix transcriptional regulator [Haliea sp.]|uniref:helix-turn-helix transcriptional regulator n=1 Tax=Haliea sp. TaxID=1932666 RepID=UPI0035276A24